MIEQHYINNHRKFLKRLTFRAGTEWDAEDVIQDAYERAIKYQHSFDGSNFDKWFSTILNNALKEHKNASKGHSNSSFEEEEMEGTPCPQYSEHAIREIYKLIKTKNPVAQEVLTLHFQQDHTARDIARITDHKYITAYQIINRFRQELKEKYG